MLKLSDNPPITLGGSTLLDDDSQQWNIAYCKSRQEKALAWDLSRLQVPYFLPMLMRETFSGGRRRRNMYPLFKSYLFFSGTRDERLAVLKTNRVLHLVDIEPIDLASFRREICSLELAIRCTPEKLELHPQIASGKRIRIISGPLKDVEGVVLNADKRTKLWVGVTLFGAGVTVEIHSDLAEVIDGNSKSHKLTGEITYQIGKTSCRHQHNPRAIASNMVVQRLRDHHMLR